MKRMKLGELELPLEGAQSAQTSTVVVYGGKGMGKTNFGSVYVEELAKHGLRFSVIDPIDVWWGLQHGAKKGTEGLDVVILGGPHGDIPIEPTAGAVVADFVADETVSTIIVLRKPNGEMWSSADRIRFVTAYCSRLFMRQGERRIPLLQVIDEAGRFCPQMQGKGDFQIAECIGAIEQLVEWGRNVGVGVLLITQRSARMNKSVSELADVMVAFRTVGPNSIKAVVDWFGEHVAKDRQKGLIEQLRSLDRGTALVVSPGWLKYEGVAAIRERQTFDSSATPKTGRALRAPGRARKPDLERYRARMAETVERATADDPRELRRQIKALEGELAAAAKAPPAPPAPFAKTKTVERPVLKASDVAKVEASLDKAHALADRLSNTAAELRERAEVLREALRSAATACKRTDDVLVAKPCTVGPSTLPAPAPIPRHTPVRTGGYDPEAGPAPATQKVLNALAELRALGVERPERIQVALLAGYTHLQSKGFANALGSLSSAGLIKYPGPRLVDLTETGAARAYAPPPRTPKEIRERVIQLLGGVSGKILEPLVEAYPGSLSRDDLGRRAGYKHLQSKGFANALGRLRSLGFVDYPAPGQVVACPVLFLEPS